MTPIATEISDALERELEAVSASSRNEIGLFVGWSRTWAKASSDAPGGMISGRRAATRFSGSSDERRRPR